MFCMQYWLSFIWHQRVYTKSIIRSYFQSNNRGSHSWQAFFACQLVLWCSFLGFIYYTNAYMYIYTQCMYNELLEICFYLSFNLKKKDVLKGRYFNNDLFFHPRKNSMLTRPMLILFTNYDIITKFLKVKKFMIQCSVFLNLGSCV